MDFSKNTALLFNHMIISNDYTIKKEIKITKNKWL